MASFVYTYAKTKLLSADIDLNADDIRVLLAMANTTADTEKDAEHIADISTLDEDDGTNHARKALANEAVAADTANDRGEFDADDVVWTALGNGTRQLVGALVYKFVTNDADSINIAWIEFAAAQSPGGSDFSIQWNAEGILQLT